MKPLIRKKLHAFTLLEILVAMSIILLILGAVYGSFRAMAESISHCRPRSVLEQKANLFLLRFTSELRCSYPISRNRTAKDYPKLFKGEQVSANKTFLQFVTSSSSMNKNMGGLVIVSYKLDSSGNVLLQNAHNYTEITGDNDKDYHWSAVLSNVKTISCEYLKDGKWQKNWNSDEESNLPQAVKISLVLENDEIETVSFETCVHITCSGFRNSDSGVMPTVAAFDF